jgi:hypothetical protein
VVDIDVALAANPRHFKWLAVVLVVRVGLARLPALRARIRANQLARFHCMVDAILNEALFRVSRL